MRHLDKAALYDEEIHDLKLRFELLEGDKKAYQETTELAMKRNRADLNTLKELNKELRDRLTKLKKLEADGAATGVALSEHEKLDQKICEAHKKYDDYCAEGRDKEEKLAALMDQLELLQSSAATAKANYQSSPQAKDMRQLENSLDKAKIKQNEALSIHKTYEQIIKLLQDEKLTFDHHLRRLEESLKTRKHDTAELELLSRDAQLAKDMCKNELNRIESQLNQDRKVREKHLTARKELVKQRLQELQEKMDRKDLGMEENVENNNSGDSKKDAQSEDNDRRVMEFEENMSLIKEVMGVNSIKESLNKINTLNETEGRLNALKLEQENKIKQLKEKKLAMLLQLEDLKYCGESKSLQSKNMVDELRDRAEAGLASYNNVKLKYDRTGKVLAAAIAGVQCLFQKLELIQIPNEREQSKKVLSETSAPQLLDVCSGKLAVLATNIQGREKLIEQQVQAANVGNNSENSSPYAVSTNMLPQYNTRVKVKDSNGNLEDEDEEEQDNNNNNVEVLDRETIKKHSQQLLNAKSKSKQVKKTKKKGKDSDDE